MPDLTSKQESFARKYIELGNASEAYRQSYDCENSQPETIWTEASLLLSNPNVAQRVKELQERLNKKLEVTVESLTDEYDQVRKLALEKEQLAPAVSAITGKAKLHGLLIEVHKTKLTYEDMPDDQLIALARSKGLDVTRYTNSAGAGKETTPE